MVKKQRPYSSKPPSYTMPRNLDSGMATAQQKSIISQIQMNQQNSAAIYNIIDNHYKESPKKSKSRERDEVTMTDLGIQVDNTSQDIFEQFDKRKRSSNGMERFQPYLEDLPKPQEYQSKQPKSRPIHSAKTAMSSQKSLQNKYPSFKNQQRRNIVRGARETQKAEEMPLEKINEKPPVIKRRRTVRKSKSPPTQKGLGDILQFDPEKMNVDDVKRIADNADNLIELIQSIKYKVGQSPTNDKPTLPKQTKKVRPVHSAKPNKLVSKKRQVSSQNSKKPEVVQVISSDKMF